MNWNKLIDFIQAAMIFLLIMFVAVCILTLIGFDSVVGAGSMMYLTVNNLKASVGISIATSGLLMSLMFIGYSATSRAKTNFIKTAGVIILGAAGLIYLMDIYFDSLTADYLRYGRFVALSELSEHDKVIQMMFRGLIGGLSTVGESLAVAIILGMPVLKNILSDALPTDYKDTRHNKPYNKPNPDNSAKKTIPVAPVSSLEEFFRKNPEFARRVK